MRWYEVGFDGDVVDAVHRITPDADVTDLPVCTILWSRNSTHDDLDALLDTLSALGITPREVHESAGATSYSEVRIRGCLGDAMLRYLGWSHRVAKTTVVRLWTDSDELRAMLSRMASVTRLDYVLAL